MQIHFMECTAELKAGMIVDGLSNVWRDVTGHARMYLLNRAHGGEDLPGRAVAALKSIAVEEGALHRVKFFTCGETFDGDDVLTLARCRQRQAGQDALTFDDDGAGTTRALIASLLRAGQTELVAKRVE